MINIEIAGAGAGKTYGLARRIINSYNTNSSKTIYALTYTNAAKENISKEIIKQYKNIPDKIKVVTIHDFLINQIIIPYAHLVTEYHINSSSTQKLSDKIPYKQKTLKYLKGQNVIHIDEVYSFSRAIINPKGKNKKIKKHIEIIYQLLESHISHIFIDECQDLDSNCLDFFYLLSGAKLEIYMIGDPKQSIKYPSDFNDFLSEHYLNKLRNNEKILINNISRRIPNKILKISNYFCPEGQEQSSIDDRLGIINLLKIDHSTWINDLDENDMIILDRSNEFYSTSKGNDEISLPFELKEIIPLSSIRKNRDIKTFTYSFVEDILSMISELNENDKVVIARKLIAKYMINKFIFCQENKNKNYAILLDFIESLINNKEKTSKVLSIDKSKGLESDNVYFILSNSTLNYIKDAISNKTPKNKKHNKEWNKVYVALTRTKNKLTFVLDERLINENNITSFTNTINHYI
ncbi:UvrD-helicase domain-containing protein [Proteus mirabilis]|uniref:UvrD-helicase domain-containing protein n=1 Tax=Proteus mirabilis TaxID=584 RepID=UPI00128FC848|nr:UvrD-helicase domain-containing protein [Proteus mirabilis]QFV08804.1 AAA family ATPase [Proteus mirabilis]